MLEEFYQINKNEIISRAERHNQICIIKLKKTEEDCLFDWLPQHEKEIVINSTSSMMAVKLIGHF
jgi:hypothetical protein